MNQVRRRRERRIFENPITRDTSRTIKKIDGEKRHSTCSPGRTAPTKTTPGPSPPIIRSVSYCQVPANRFTYSKNDPRARNDETRRCPVLRHAFNFNPPARGPLKTQNCCSLTLGGQLAETRRPL